MPNRQNDADVKLDILHPMTMVGGIPDEYQSDCYHMENYRNATFILDVMGMGPGDTLTATVFDDDRETGGGAPMAVIDPTYGAVTATVVGNTDVQQASVTFGVGADVPVNGDTVTVNGVTFTYAAATSEPDREFTDLAGLIDCINDPDYGVSLVEAVDETTHLTLRSIGRGLATITLTSSTDARLICRTVMAQLYLEIDQGAVNKVVPYRFPNVGGPGVAPYDYAGIWAEATLVTAASLDVAGVVVRGRGRHAPKQQVAARDTRGV